jgi:hypothetical protein
LKGVHLLVDRILQPVQDAWFEQLPKFIEKKEMQNGIWKII